MRFSKSELFFLIEEGNSIQKISKLYCCAGSTIQYWLNIFDLKTQGRVGCYLTSEKAKELSMSRWSSNPPKILSWEEIQKDFNNGMTVREICSKYRICWEDIRKAKAQNLFTSDATRVKRVKPRKPLSADIRNKMSALKKDWLAKNPDKHNWKMQSKCISVPCQHLKRIFAERNINFVEEYQPLTHIRRYYSIDIAFPNQKIGIEINGNQHYEKPSVLKPYYQIRHNLIEAHGWKLYEIHYSLVYNQEFIENIISEIGSVV